MNNRVGTTDREEIEFVTNVENLKSATEKNNKEKEKLDTERAKLDKEREKLEQEIYSYPKALLNERLKSFGSIGTLIVAMAAFGTLVFNLSSYKEETARETSQDIALLLKDLGDENYRIRASSAIALAAYLNNEAYADTLTKSLGYAISLEDNEHVVDAILGTLMQAGKLQRENLLQARSRMSEQVIPLYTDIYYLDQDIDKRLAIT